MRFCKGKGGTCGEGTNSVQVYECGVVGLNPGRLWWCAPGDAVLSSDPVLAAFLPVKGYQEPYSSTRSTSLDLLPVGWLGLAPFLCLPAG